MDWPAAHERLQAPVFAPLQPALARLPRDRWPTHHDLNGLAEGVVTSRQQPVRFVDPREHTDRERRYYEVRVAESGEVETRPENWHDLFNALAWITYPRAKAQLNAQHAAILEEGGEQELRQRSPERDALTLFDEGGVAIASDAPDLKRLVVDFEWKELFWRRRAEAQSRMCFLAFGHGCFEQCLAPYIGMVAKTVFVPVRELFFMLPREAQVEQVDGLLAAHFAQRARFPSPKSMPPMPILGVPGWHFAAQDEAFYDDPSHFRSKGPKNGVRPQFPAK
ncbi:MAG TPA: DUF3025 domain-containing protein [Usitatibacter sp.]|nr:DUF3025 domain-containing protein [Usitatibacter sp.]